MYNAPLNIPGSPGAYPNIIQKRKLVPLPLLRQNKSPQALKSLLTNERSPFGFKTSSSSFFSPERPAPGFRIKTHSDSMQSPTGARSPNQSFLKELKTINNYGRLCDQPFIEFSTAHFQQIFGNGTGKKQIPIQPLNKIKGRKITKLGTVEGSALRSPIKVHDSVNVPARVHKIKNEDKDNQSVIKKVYKIGEYEAVIGFYSLEVVFMPLKTENGQKITIRLGKDDLKRVYKYPHNHIVDAVANSLSWKGRWVQDPIKKDKSLKCEIYTGEETYPEKKDGLSAELLGRDYDATIYYPYLDITIKELDYNERIMLKPAYLANLFAGKFDNLQDYVQKFNIPPQVYKTREELHNDELKALPPIIKRVLKDAEFGGLMLFKSIEIHLKNTSEIEPETTMGESKLTPMAKNIMRKKKKDVNNVVLRVEINELNKLTRATAEEITDLIKNSIIIEEGAGFILRLDEHKTTILNDRKEIEVDSLPDYSEKFTIRFNRFLYEGYIKFPTLELYVPETNFKDIIQLKPSQLRVLVDGEFKNMQDFLPKFKKPRILTEPSDLGSKPRILTEQSEEVQVNDNIDSPSKGQMFTFKEYSINIGN